MGVGYIFVLARAGGDGVPILVASTHGLGHGYKDGEFIGRSIGDRMLQLLNDEFRPVQTPDGTWTIPPLEGELKRPVSEEDRDALWEVQLLDENEEIENLQDISWLGAVRRRALALNLTSQKMLDLFDQIRQMDEEEISVVVTARVPTTSSSSSGGPTKFSKTGAPRVPSLPSKEKRMGAFSVSEKTGALEIAYEQIRQLVDTDSRREGTSVAFSNAKIKAEVRALATILEKISWDIIVAQGRLRGLGHILLKGTRYDPLPKMQEKMLDWAGRMEENAIAWSESEMTFLDKQREYWRVAGDDETTQRAKLIALGELVKDMKRDRREYLAKHLTLKPQLDRFHSLIGPEDPRAYSATFDGIAKLSIYTDSLQKEIEEWDTRVTGEFEKEEARLDRLVGKAGNRWREI